MTCCNHCRDAESFFGRGTGRRELRRYRRRGPSASTQLLLESMRAEGVQGASLLDVGGGIGAIQHELIPDGLARVLHVDASRPYLEVAREEARRRGHDDRIEQRHGDVVELAGELPKSDFVTLDRVVCCYPALEALLDACAGRSRRVIGLVYPRVRWGTRGAMAIGNLWFRVRGSAFRVFLHPPALIDAVLEARGFHRVRSDRTFLWAVETYRREG